MIPIYAQAGPGGGTAGKWSSQPRAYRQARFRVKCNFPGRRDRRELVAGGIQ